MQTCSTRVQTRIESGLESVFAGLELKLGSKRFRLGLGLGTIGLRLGTKQTWTYSLFGLPILAASDSAKC